MVDIKKLFSNKAFLIECICFVVLQIFIDMYRIFFESSIQIFGISLPELINLAYLAGLTVVFVIRSFKKPKQLIPIGIYTLLLVAYLALHIFNILKFNQHLLTGSELNWFKELYFITRTYLIPVYVFYYLLCSDLKTVSFKKIVSILSIIVSSNIVLTNIFKISFICYASTLEGNAFITRNVFEWFFNPDTQNPVFMTSKGWFYMGNQIGLILLMLLVFVVMFAFESGKIGSYIVVFLNAFAMILVGTKVSTLGCCIILVAGLILAIIFGVGLKQFTFKLKQVATYIVLSALCLALVSYSPMFNIQNKRSEASITTEEQQSVIDNLSSSFESIQNYNDPEHSNESDSSTQKDPQVVEQEKAKFKEDFCKYVNSAPYFFGFDPEFLELFPIEENFDFWYKMVVNGNNKQVDYRYFKSAIYEEVIRLNNNEFSDRLLGIGYISNFLYSERDFISQNIWFGYLGTALFIGPYLILVAYSVLLALRKIKSCFVYQNAFFALGIGMPLILSIMAGHLFYGIFSITVFAFISAGFFKFQTERFNAQ